jgi:hypothetical protein
MEMCAEAHPLCKGVSWNVDMIAGYGNCYLKNDPSAGEFAPSPGYITHSAEVTSASLQQVNGTCPSNKTYASSNGKNFAIDCYDGRIGSENFTSVHIANVSQCMETCATNTGQACLGVVFDISMENGWDNCYLLNSTGSPNVGTNATFAQLWTNSTSISSHSSSSKAWIAGPVLGAIAVIALILGFFWWWRLRSRSRRAQQQPLQSPGFRDMPLKTPSVSNAYDGVVEVEAHAYENIPMLPGDNALHELQDTRRESILPQELGAGPEHRRLS